MAFSFFTAAIGKITKALNASGTIRHGTNTWFQLNQLWDSEEYLLKI